MPMADSVRATAPNSASSSIGERRPSSDRAIHCPIVRTSAIGCSGSIDATAERTCDTSACSFVPVFTTSAIAAFGCWATG